MSIGFIKRILFFANLAALLVIGLAAWGYWQHREAVKEPPKRLQWSAKVKADKGGDVRIKDISMVLGRFPKKADTTKTEVKEEPKVDVLTALQKYGTITNAVVVYPPYTSVWPTISFEKSGSKEIRVIRVGEALEMKREPGGGPLDLVPHRYKFLRCEPDPKNPGWTYFVFDMECDGKDIQKARWLLEDQKLDGWKEASADTEDGIRTVSDSNVSIRIEGDRKKQPTKVEPVKPNPANPQPEQPATPVPEKFDGTMFDANRGTMEVTAEGARFLKERYQDLVGDVRSRTYKDPRTKRPSGIQITKIRPGSMANSFGLRKDDVILAVNDRPVTSKDEAMKVVKEELKRSNNPIIRVKILRFGAQKILRFDSRDPATRRAARDAMR